MEATMTMKQEAVPVVRSSLALKRKALELGLHQYEERLAKFERQFQMSSDDFSTKFQAGKLEDDQVWFDWEFVLEAYRETRRQLELLASVNL
jgi:hypothetical protein